MFQISFWDKQKFYWDHGDKQFSCDKVNERSSPVFVDILA